MMQIMQMEQGSPQWHEFRKSHIMATDASVIMGINPWKTARELWEEKLDLRHGSPMNAAMDRGIKLEPAARAIAIEQLGEHFEPCVVKSKKKPWQAASLDGFSSLMRIVLEIKCPGKNGHLMAIDGKIPLYYQAQIQHQLMVCNSPAAYYMSYRPEEKKKPYVFILVKPDLQMINNLILVEQYFYEKNLCVMNPPQYEIAA